MDVLDASNDCIDVFEFEDGVDNSTQQIGTYCNDRRGSSKTTQNGKTVVPEVRQLIQLSNSCTRSQAIVPEISQFVLVQ